MTDAEVAKRLEELKLYTKQSLNVEQRIEIARQQQALRDAKKMAKDDMSRSKDKVTCRLDAIFESDSWIITVIFRQQPISYQRGKQSRDVEKVERLEAQRKERELKNQQALEVSTLFRKQFGQTFLFITISHPHQCVSACSVQFR